ncbi:hypothetical protein BC937DRAFT_92040, partial [Endogone sp. FLAS-F59071]
RKERKVVIWVHLKFKFPIQRSSAGLGIPFRSEEDGQLTMPIDDSDSDEEYFGIERRDDDHRGDANTDPAANITITLTTLEKSSAKITIGKAEALEALLKKISGSYNPSATRYILTIQGGAEIDLDEDEMTMDQLKLTNGSVIVMSAIPNMNANPLHEKSREPSSTVVSIDMSSNLRIPSQNPSTIYLQQQVPENSIVHLENEGAVNADSPQEKALVDKNLYFKGSATITEEFYFEVTLKLDYLPTISRHANIFLSALESSVWLGFVTANWFTLSEAEKFGLKLWDTATWNYDTSTGALNYGKITYTYDPIYTDNDITLGFGVARSKDKGEDGSFSVFYVNDDGPAKEIVRHGTWPDDLYPAVCLRQPHTDLAINSMGPFKYQGRERLRNPHKTPVGLFECSPDRRYAALFSAGDGIISVWRLYDEPLPKLVKHISVSELIVNGIEASQDSTEKHSHKLITLAVSNTTGDLPKLALSRYHPTLPQGTSRVFFLNYASSEHYLVRPNKINGRIHILDDGDTLLILSNAHIFVMSMKSQALLRTFDTNELSISTAMPSIGLHVAPSAGADRPLKPFGSRHFIWHYDAKHVTMWDVSSGRLEQSFRLTFQAEEKYDYDKTHNLVAFYGIHGLRIFTTQTGIKICEAERLFGAEHFESHTIIVVTIRFVTIDGVLRLVTVDGDEYKYIVRIWNPLNGTIVKEITSVHPLSERFIYSYQDIKMEEPSLVKLVTPLMATVAFFTVDLSLPRHSETLHAEDLDINNPSDCVEFEGKSSTPTIPRLQITKQQAGLPKSLVEVIGFRKRPVTINPEPWNDRPLMPCHWISENLFVAIGRHSVQIIDAKVASPTKVGIKFAWCLPFHEATIDAIRLMRDDANVLRQMVITYQHEKKPHKDIVAVDIEHLSISPMHASRFLQFAGLNYANSAPAYEHNVALQQVLKSPKDALLLNEIDFKTRTSPVGHIVRGPPTLAIERLKLLFESRACRPLFYHHKKWDKSVLTDALDTQKFAVVAEILKYCLQSLSTTDGTNRNTMPLELGYMAIILEALPVISRAKPLMATWIAQYLSHVQPSQFIQGFHEVEYDSRKSRSQIFARVEELSNVEGFQFAVHKVIHGLPPLRWLKSQHKLFLAWWNKERLPRPVRLCIAPLYGINRYPSDHLPFKLSVFAQLAFRQSSVFDEPAFRAFVQYKWNAFARRYYLGLLILYISYALIYLIAVSVDPYTLEDIPALKYILLAVTVVFMCLFDLRPLFTRWHSLTYWSSIYHWVDRTAFVMPWTILHIAYWDRDQSRLVDYPRDRDPLRFRSRNVDTPPQSTDAVISGL